jgi:hypothetical protein
VPLGDHLKLALLVLDGLLCRGHGFSQLTFVCSFKGEGACDGLKERHRRAPIGAGLTDLVALLQQFDDAIDGFDRPFLRNDALLHEQV